MKTLQQILKEGLFDNIGIGIKSKVENWLKDMGWMEIESEDEVPLSVSPLVNKQGKYIYNEDDSSIDLYLITTTDLNPHTRRFPQAHVDIPNFIRVNKLQTDSSSLKMTNIHCDDWEGFLPKEIISFPKLNQFVIHDCDIDDKSLMKLIKPFIPNNINIWNCHQLNKLKFSLKHKTQNDLTLENCKLSSLDLSSHAVFRTSIYIFNTDIQNIKLKSNSKSIEVILKNSNILDTIIKDINDKKDLTQNKYIKEFIKNLNDNQEIFFELHTNDKKTNEIFGFIPQALDNNKQINISVE